MASYDDEKMLARENRSSPGTNSHTLPKPSSAGPEGRRTERIMVDIPIRVTSFESSAGTFVEETRTILVNRHGALIRLKHSLAPGEFLRVVNLSNLREADFRVVELSHRESAESGEWGLECLDQDRSIWDIDFSPPLRTGEAKGGALLRCLGCGKQSFLVVSLSEVGILESSGALEKLCEQCGELSRWMFVEETRRLEKHPPVLPANGVPSPESVRWDGKNERRANRRLTLKLPVRVRSRNGNIEVGRTENITKDGLALQLSFPLALAERVSVICPYSGDANDIEKQAEVRHRRSFYEGYTWVYGFQHVQSKSTGLTR